MFKIIISFSWFILLSCVLFGQSKQEMTVTNLEKVNSPALEFSPAFYHHGVVYVSSKYRHGNKDNNINENTFDLLYADLGPFGKMSKPGPFSLKVNTVFHEGPVSFTADMNKMYFTRNNFDNGKVKKDEGGTVRLKIFEATRGKEDWENIKDLPFNDDQYSNIHPSISKDGSRLYFASDRPGGFGGMDLYYVMKTNNGWSDPINMGATINTPRTEAFPFIHPSGKLFFSSNRRESLGALDIFMVDVREDRVGKIEYLPEPINSFHDDLGLMLSASGEVGFFTSARPNGKGKDDIYRVEIPGGLKGLYPPKEMEATVIVTNYETGEHLSYAQIRVLKNNNSEAALHKIFKIQVQETQEKEVVLRYVIRPELMDSPDVLTADEQGMAKVKLMENQNYLVIASHPDFKTGSTDYLAIASSEDAPVIYVRLWPRPKKVAEVPPPPLEVGTIIVLDQLYYDFDKSYIRTDASRGLDAILSLMNQYPEMTIDLTAHTDSRGSKDYNLDLSDRRSASAKYYLTSRGVGEERIKAMGVGEARPRNGCKDGVKCTETEHQYNRRTEVKITNVGTDTKRIEYFDNDPEYVDRMKVRKKK